MSHQNSIRQAYIAGKYTSETPAETRENIERAIVAALLVGKAGFHVIVPHSMGSHRSTWNSAMAQCRLTISSMDPSTDVLVVIPGWEFSRGAREEVTLANGLGIPVRTLAEVLG